MKRLVTVILAACFITALPSGALALGVYLVKSGDNLYRIAKSFNLSAEELSRANSLTSTLIKPGMKLAIPGKHTAPKEMIAADISQAAGTSSQSCVGEMAYHTVRRGDTLWDLSRRYRVNLQDVLDWNSLSRKSKLQIGQVLVVRNTGPRIHTVKKGDTLESIAARYHVTSVRLRELNNLDQGDMAVGRTLYLEPCRAEMAMDADMVYDLLEPALVWNIPGLGEESTLDMADLGGGGDQTPYGQRHGIAERAIAFAKNMLNIPYRFGGSTFRGIDCSAYVQKVFSFLGIPLPRTAREQFQVGNPIATAELSPGDLVFFRTYARYPSHVGIYLGGNLFIHASSRTRKVSIDTFSSPYYRKRYLGAKRLFSGEEVAAAANGQPI